MINSIKRYCVGIFLIFVLHVQVGNTKTIYEQCNESNNTTLVCNYIPKQLSRNYKYVRIVDFKREDKIVTLNSSSFIHESWAKVQTIEFNDQTGLGFVCIFSRECFKGLIYLKELKIHVSHFQLEKYAFVGLPLVHTLDVSKCYRLVIHDVCKALEVKSALPVLKNLIMSEIGTYRNGNNINQENVNYILPRNITKVDLSRMPIKFVNSTAVFKTLVTLETINISYTVIADSWGSEVDQKDIRKMKVFDVSNLVFPTKIVYFLPGKYVFANKTGKYSQMMSERLMHIMKTFFTPMLINMSGIVPPSSSLWIYNYNVTIDVPLGWAVKELIVRNNNFRYLDVYIAACTVYKLTSLFHLDLSDNGLEMVHPTMCLPNLEKIVLSNNNIFRMQEKSRNLFGNLFASQTKLREINLSNNRLLEIPKKMFKHNNLLERIDLSFNKLQQLHFDMIEMNHLRILEVSNNNIKVLDEISINSLDGLPSLGPHIPVDNRCLVKMKLNPFLCSTCACKSSIQWIVSLTKLNIEQHNLVCKTEDKTFIKLDESVTIRIQNICNRKFIIIISTVCTSVTLMAVCIIGFILQRRKRRFKRQRNMETVLARLIEGEGQYEFVAFLSHSSNDHQFVQDHVINQLNENLKLIIGTDRDLICTGDQNYRPGFTIHDETERCLNRASVVILLVSNNFCRSQYCQNEMDKAYLLSKPVVLMLFGNVDEEIMMPTLHGLYKRDARILWKIENGQFVLNTTWENICTSLLEKVAI